MQDGQRLLWPVFLFGSMEPLHGNPDGQLLQQQVSDKGWQQSLIPTMQ